MTIGTGPPAADGRRPPHARACARSRSAGRSPRRLARSRSPRRPSRSSSPRSSARPASRCSTATEARPASPTPVCGSSRAPRSILAELEAATAELSAAAAEVTGDVHVAAFPSAERALLAPAVRALLAATRTCASAPPSWSRGCAAGAAARRRRPRVSPRGRRPPGRAGRAARAGRPPGGPAPRRAPARPPGRRGRGRARAPRRRPLGRDAPGHRLPRDARPRVRARRLHALDVPFHANDFGVLAAFVAAGLGVAMIPELALGSRRSATGVAGSARRAPTLAGHAPDLRGGARRGTSAGARRSPRWSTPPRGDRTAGSPAGDVGRLSAAAVAFHLDPQRRSEADRPARDRTPLRAHEPARPPTKTWSTWWPATCAAPARRPRRVQVAAEHERRARGPRQRRRRSHQIGAPLLRRVRDACRFTTHPAPPSATPCITRRSGFLVSSRSRCSRTLLRTRIALQPPPRRPAGRGCATRSPAARSSELRPVSALRAVARSPPAAAATTAAPPAAARRPTTSRRARRRTRPAAAAPPRVRAAVEEVPAQDEDRATLADAAVLRAVPRHFITGAELSGRPGSPDRLLDRALELKADPPPRAPRPAHVALVFEQPSTRTRTSFEAGIVELGGHPMVLRPASCAHPRRVGPRHGARPVPPRRRHRPAHGVGRDARRAGRARHVPVVNMLSPRTTRCQALADLLTMREAFGEITAAGSPTSATATTSPARSPSSAGRGVEVTRRRAGRLPARAGLRARRLADDPRGGRGRRRRLTDVWVSMGDDGPPPARRRRPLAYRIDDALLDRAAPGRSRCTACPPTRARRSPRRCSTARRPADLGPGGEPPARAEGAAGTRCSGRQPHKGGQSGVFISRDR